MNNTTKKYAVFGNPIAHSKSPQIHLEFAAQFGINLEYEKLLIGNAAGAFEETLASALLKFRQMGGRGANITVPFKEDAFHLAELAHAPALSANAANTLWWGEDNALIASNTDGIGFLRDIEVNAGFPIKDKSILIIGAGGAARGIVMPLLGVSPEYVHIANRTPERAANLAQSFANYYAEDESRNKLGASAMLPKVQAIPLELLFGEESMSYDLIINATSAALGGDGKEGEALFSKLNHDLAHSGTLCYDMIYGRETAFIRWAKTHQADWRDGWGMLVEQAAESFFLWHHERPDTKELLADV